MAEINNRKLILENGDVYVGQGFGSDREVICELTANQSMVCYQDVIMGAQSADLLVVMQYPLIGNCGITKEAMRIAPPLIGGLIVRELNEIPSNFRKAQSLDEYLTQNDIPVISGVDTRKITKTLKNSGPIKGMLTDIAKDEKKALEEIRAYTAPKDGAYRASCKEVWHYQAISSRLHAIIIDMGVDPKLIRELNDMGCNVTLVPITTDIKTIEAMDSDGIVFSDGAGNPADCVDAIRIAKAFSGKVPMFGVGLGMDVLALALGADTYKLKFAHRSQTHPVRNIKTGKLQTVSQNHGYAIVDESIVNTDIDVTMRDESDNCIEAFEVYGKKIKAIQFDIDYTNDDNITQEFVDMMRGGMHNA